MTVRIPARELAKAYAHAGDAYPEECCGFLIGIHGAARDILEVRRARNVHPDHREVRYSVDPRQQLQVERELQGTRREVLGFYHSHPDHPGVPSAFDIDRSWREYSYVIIEVRHSRSLRARSFRIDREAGSVEEERLVVVRGPPRKRTPSNGPPRRTPRRKRGKRPR